MNPSETPEESPKKGRFSSFDALKRSLDPSDSPPEGASTPSGGESEGSSSGPGWTLDGQGAEELADWTAEQRADMDARSRIQTRPAAFGPMEGGPLPYRDAHSEEMVLLYSHRVRTVFPPDVLSETSALPPDPCEADWAGRQDLRGQTIFTIDGDDAKDYDDAIAIVDLGAGRMEVSVHIADVSHYVVPGTALDEEGMARGTSVYLADQVVPMLPEALSNGLCSLVPDRNRLAFSVHMIFDEKGKRESYRVAKSVIRSVKRCTYRGVQAVLDRQETEESKALAFLEPSLRLFEQWTKIQQGIRDARGSLRINSTEKKIQFDDKHEVVAVVDAPRYFSQTLIEETALAANQAVGDLFVDRGLPTIYRVHPEKDPDEIDVVARGLEQFGIRVPSKERLTGRDIGQMIRAARRKANSEALIQRIMGLIERAVYEVRDHEDVATHFGLARKAYLHFTSPIRRYPDLLVHRWLHEVTSRGEQAADDLRTDDILEDLNQIASHCSMQGDMAQICERAIFDLKICQFLEPHIGERTEARILRVSRGGLEIVLTEYNVTGFLPMKKLGDRGDVKGPNLVVRKGRQHRSFSEGGPVQVLIDDVDFMRLQVLLDLA